MKKKVKTLAVKVLEGGKIEHTVHTYDPKERDASSVADLLAVPVERVFKSLVVLRERGKPIIVMVPSHRQLNLKRLAAEMGEKKLKMASHAEAEKLTKLKVGGISPLALLNRGFQMAADRSILEHARVFVSGGQKGINLEVPSAGLVEIVNAKIVDVATD